MKLANTFLSSFGKETIHLDNNDGILLRVLISQNPVDDTKFIRRFYFVAIYGWLAFFLFLLSLLPGRQHSFAKAFSP